jgi:rhamnose utilization protein RhaD (predicted bifunctional aldolase and dehydrogenase)
VRKLAGLGQLSDPQMVNELNTHMLRAGRALALGRDHPARDPAAQVRRPHPRRRGALGVESPEGEKRIREIYGDAVVVIPYIMAGFDLAAYCAREFPEAGGQEHGRHGAALARRRSRSVPTRAASYELMIELVSMAEEYLAKEEGMARRLFPGRRKRAASAFKPEDFAKLRRAISDQAEFPVILKVNDSEKFIGFARRPNVQNLSGQGPATPDHVIRTKPFPMLGRDVVGYAGRYREYFERFSAKAKEKKTMLDAAPRMALDPGLGLVAAGRTAKDAVIVEELYDHTVDVILRAEALGGWRALDQQHTFDIEYWDLEQAKLRKAGSPPAFSGEVALVTGAASGIGKACVESFLKRGAAVIGLDRNPAIEAMWKRAGLSGTRLRPDRPEGRG